LYLANSGINVVPPRNAVIHPEKQSLVQELFNTQKLRS